MLLLLLLLQLPGTPVAVHSSDDAGLLTFNADSLLPAWSVSLPKT